MFSSTVALVLVSSLIVIAEARDVARSPNSGLHRRLTGQDIAFACFGGGGDCQCPIDNNGDSGVLINVYPGYQCAYPNGACTFNMVSFFEPYMLQLVLIIRFIQDNGALMNALGQSNCVAETGC